MVMSGEDKRDIQVRMAARKWDNAYMANVIINSVSGYAQGYLLRYIEARLKINPNAFDSFKPEDMNEEQIEALLLEQVLWLSGTGKDLTGKSSKGMKKLRDSVKKEQLEFLRERLELQQGVDDLSSEWDNATGEGDSSGSHYINGGLDRTERRNQRDAQAQAAANDADRLEDETRDLNLARMERKNAASYTHLTLPTTAIV